MLILILAKGKCVVITETLKALSEYMMCGLFIHSALALC